MPNKRYNKQVPGFMKGGRVKKMGGGSMNGKPVSKSKNPGLAKMAKSPKGKEAIKKMGFNPNRMVAKKGGRA
jgi:fatty acid-binding protein DegV